MSSAPYSALRAPRSTWSRLTDDQLLAQCEVDTYRASGPGGQKRNKTSSAVRLRHAPTGLTVIAEESRSQHENKAKALRRLSHALFLHLRDELPPGSLTPEAVAAHPDYAGARDAAGRLHMSPKCGAEWESADRPGSIATCAGCGNPVKVTLPTVVPTGERDRCPACGSGDSVPLGDKAIEAFYAAYKQKKSPFLLFRPRKCQAC